MEQLSTIRSRNRDQFITEYIHEQRQYRHLYTVAGKAERNTWDSPKGDTAQSDPLSFSQGNKTNDFVFDTPVLHARTAKGKENAENALPERRSAHRDDNRTKLSGGQKIVRSRNAASGSPDTVSDHSLHCDKTTKESKRNPRFKASKTVHQAKRRVHEKNSDDDEQENRLAERRQRKKAKKSIMKPQVKHGHKTHERGPRKKIEAKTQAGFALMHGFSATNVGKNRLTLDCLAANINNGVFMKGKASDATKISKSSTKKTIHPGRRDHFVESTFLNAKRNKKNASSQSRSPTPSSFSSTSHSSSEEEDQKISNIHPKKKHKASPESGPAEPSPRANKVHPKYNPEDSVIWDIEKDSSLSLPRNSSDHGQGTVIVTLPKSIKVQEKLTSNVLAERLTKSYSSPAEPLQATVGSDTPGQLGSTVSLGPSQSASQVAKAAPCSNKISGYFSSAHKPVDARKSALSVPPAHIVKEIVIESVDPKSFHTVEDTSHSAPKGSTAMEPLLFDEDHDDLLGLLSTDPKAYLSCFDESRQHGHVSSYWSEISWDELETGRADDFFEYNGFQAGLSNHVGFEIEDVPSLETSPSCERSPELFYEEDYMHCDEHQYPEITYLPVELEDPVVLGAFADVPGFPENPFQPYFFLPREIPIDNEEEDPQMAYNNPDPALSEVSGGDISCVQTDQDESIQETDNFYQGRFLLHGFSTPLSRASPGINALSAVEAEVAAHLKSNHWLPQKL